MGGGRMRAPPPRAARIGGAESLSEEGWEEGGWREDGASSWQLAPQLHWLPGGRGGGGTDRDQQTLAGGAGPTVPGRDTAGTATSTDTCAPRQDAAVRQVHAAHTCLPLVAETLLDKHIPYKGGQPSADGDTYTSHTKTQGRRAARGRHRQAGPRHRCALPHGNSRASPRPARATKYATDKDPRGRHGDMPRHTATTHRCPTNGQQRTPVDTGVTHTDTQPRTSLTHTHTHTHRHHSPRDPWTHKCHPLTWMHVSHARIRTDTQQVRGGTCVSQAQKRTPHTSSQLHERDTRLSHRPTWHTPRNTPTVATRTRLETQHIQNITQVYKATQVWSIIR